MSRASRKRAHQQRVQLNRQAGKAEVVKVQRLRAKQEMHVIYSWMDQSTHVKCSHG